MTYKLFNKLIVLLLAGALAIIAVFNYYFDSSQIFGSGRRETEMAKIMLSGKNVPAKNYDARLLQKIIINMQPNHQIIALGSSRVLNVNAELFPEKTFFNHGVTAGVLEDYIAIYEMYKKKNNVPETVIIGAEPHLFNPNHGIQLWRTNEKEYKEAISRMGLKLNDGFSKTSFEFAKYKELFSWAYTKASIKEASGKNRLVPQEDTDSEYVLKLKDGSQLYPNSFRNKTRQRLREDALSLLERGPKVIMLHDYHELDRGRLNLFAIFIKSMQEDGVKVIFLMPPYHPMIYEAFTSNPQYQIVPVAQQYFLEFAKQNSIQVIGSWNPKECGVQEDEFWDSMHPKTETINRLVEKLKL